MSCEKKPSCEQIIDILPDPFVVIDNQFHIVAANHRYCDKYGVAHEDIVGRFCYEVSHHSSVPCSHHGEHCPQEDVFRKGKPSQVIHVHYDQHGHEERVQLQATPILDEDGNVLYMGEYVYPLSQAFEDHVQLIGRSRAFLQMTGLLQRVAPTQTTVLLLGESGTGKECVAQYLHNYSNRANGPYVVVDCAALGSNLIESELFGHEKGAFTGAAGCKKGLFEAAHGGTLFIDEIGELPLDLQTKLLRALETGTIRRIGGTDYIKVDVRVIAATHRDVKHMVAEGTLRKDLYYRLSAFPVTIPALRERLDDVPALAENFLSRLEDGDRHIPLSPEVISRLLEYDYPGNVRELRNIIERAAILAYGGVLDPEHLVFESTRSDSTEPSGYSMGRRRPAKLLNRRSGRLTDDEIMETLEQCKGHRASAAAELGVSERTLYRYIQRMRGDEAEA
ncbi:hypothetical protein BOW53_01585 [Solemya pervernicosa gill symbiont]|uniref:Sigma-54 factor interaction domain-containing protein n=2 Tax=Gammaproteobacteria incertae sedis TaxID=118884 RepID=A0A1T2LAC7_9GAMM|nr:sigma 54-interacting transcriptional regulator [Candidatus Reidiella endopervernicosa]OOZ42053.1 hypothetical protein BOW53_01585 [Solemya pervernicosa gill symbiont]QKQ26998.1 sigma 54-interacting transcriptional regulator [Candidatus Reidiella endopervernicosa]